jgi:hypothetical protein
VCVWVCMYVYVCMYVWMYMNICMYVHMYVCMCVFVCVCDVTSHNDNHLVCTSVTWKYVNLVHHFCLCVVQMHEGNFNLHGYAFITCNNHVQTFMLIQACVTACISYICLLIRIFMRIFMPILTHIHAYIHAYTHAYFYAYFHTFLHVFLGWWEWEARLSALPEAGW